MSFKMRIVIRKWYGRFGNNFAQLRNAIQIAFYNGYQSVIFPKHKFIKCDCIVINKDNKNTKSLFDDKDFFGHPEVKVIDLKLSYEERIKIVNIIQDNFTIDLKKVKVLGDDELVIHVRSGDIFAQHPHPAYVLPPYSYYKSILDSGKFKTIHLVCEDMKNPMIKKLLDNYPNIKCQKRNLINDMKMILGSKNVVESFGTFTPILIMLSNNIKHVYKPSYQGCPIKKKDVEYHNVDLDDYRKKMHPWDNSEEKRKYMLEH